MTLYDELRHHRSAPAEQKIKILREELLRPILTVQTSAELLREFAPEISGCLPPDISAEERQNTVKWLVDAAGDLRQVLDAPTEAPDIPAHRAGS
jgi:hypothetical protein